MSNGIIHIEDLQTLDFLQLLQSLDEYDVTEKIDGAQILFGIDEIGFYTSRESKGGGRVYSVAEYNSGFTSTYKRAAHLLLEEISPIMKSAGLKPGDQVEAEVLYGELPNVVPYSSATNYIVFLRTTQGTVNIDNLKDSLKDCKLSISVDCLRTRHGKDSHMVTEVSEWECVRSPQITIDIPVIQAHISPHITELTQFLNKISCMYGQTNSEIALVQLNRRPEWCPPDEWKLAKEDIKGLREYIRSRIANIKEKVKEELLTSTVRKLSSAFGPTIADGGWIEGIVLRNRASGSMVKLVDKSTFGKIRVKSWEIRNNISAPAVSCTSAMSIMGKLRVDMGVAIGHGELGTVHLAKYLHRLGISAYNDIAPHVTGINVDSVKLQWENILSNNLSQLNDALAKYIMEPPADYMPGVKRRTLETFSKAFSTNKYLTIASTSAKTSTDLFLVLAKQQLSKV